jgi:hypothetical protein
VIRFDDSLVGCGQWSATPIASDGSFLRSDSDSGSDDEVVTKAKSVEFTLSAFMRGDDQGEGGRGGEEQQSSAYTKELGSPKKFTVEFLPGVPATVTRINKDDALDDVAMTGVEAAARNETGAGVSSTSVIRGNCGESEAVNIRLACFDAFGHRTAPRGRKEDWQFILEDNRWISCENIHVLSTGEASVRTIEISKSSKAIPRTGLEVTAVLRLDWRGPNDGHVKFDTLPSYSFKVLVLPSRAPGSIQVS